MRDDGFGGEVVRVLKERELRAGVTIEDFGTGGLDLAYEVMRGYDALVLIDVMRGDGPPGTLYVLEPEEAEIAAGIEDGEMIDPHAHGSADRAALRARRLGLARQRRRDRVRARRGRGARPGALARGRGRRSARGRARRSRRSPACATRRSARARSDAMHELSLAGAVIDTAERHAGGRRVTARPAAARRAAPGRARLARVLLRARRARHALRGRGARVRDRRRRRSPARCGELGPRASPWQART